MLHGTRDTVVYLHDVYFPRTHAISCNTLARIMNCHIITRVISIDCCRCGSYFECYWQSES